MTLRLRTWFERSLRIVSGLLGELSDERAYARHLAACGKVHSAAEWRCFSDARLGAKFTRPKCC
jgi:hypothetical protein